MRISNFKSATIKSALAASFLLSASGAALAQQVINLTAAQANAALSDGSLVPMWGYSCGTVASTNAAPVATCAALNPAVVAGTWSPVVITVPTGQDLQINLTNNLTFGATSVPTSLVIVGQIGGGLGTGATSTPSPDHSAVRSQTWPIASNTPVADPTQLPPAQGNRVQSFATEVAAGATTALTWTGLLPGTYLIESGTHPSIQAPMGLYGILVVTTAPSGTTAGTAYGTVGAASAVSYNADVPLLFSEIDPVQNTAVATAVNTAGFSETKVWSGQVGGCGNPASPVGVVNTCYPPAVNYTPLYYLINGRTFDTANVAASLYPVTATSGNVLVRLVNAGLRMHVPSIVGSTTGLATAPVSGMTLVAEDGNVLPGQARIQNEVFMAAGKTYDVSINVPAACTPIAPATTCSNPALPIYDRQLSLSANATGRNGGMLAYIGINGAAAPANSGTLAGAAVANPDNYSLVPGQMLRVSDQSKGVIANDKGVYAVQLLAAPTNGSVTLFPNGTFDYFPTIPTTGSPATGDTFTYCANGAVTGPLCTTVTLGPSAVTDAGITCTVPPTYTAATATYLAVKTPGVLAFCKDGANLPLSVNTAATNGGTLLADASGGFSVTGTGGSTATFTFTVQNPKQQTTTVTVTVAFPAASNLSVKVLDGADHTTVITDYRWIIEEDRTFYVDPACTKNPLPVGCPTLSGAPAAGTASSATINYGTNFHTSSMPVVAAGCTGALSCEGGQQLGGSNVVCDVGNGVCRPDTSGTGFAQTLPSSVVLDPSKRYYISILPGDAANPFNNAYGSTPLCTSSNGVSTPNKTCGHGMGGAPIAAACGPQSASKAACPTSPTAVSSLYTNTPVTVLTMPTPLQPATLSVFVYEDDYPLNGEHGSGGGVDVLAPQEPGLGGFQVTIFDQAGGTGDATGQPTYDMFNQPLSNSLAGTIDPVTGLDACPVSNLASANSAANAMQTSLTNGSNSFTFTQPTGVPVALKVGMPLSDSAGAIPAGTTVVSLTTVGASIKVVMSSPATTTTNDTISASLSAATGMIVTCPKFESDGTTLSPMAGQALVKNLYPGRYSIAALPGASRIALGEEWVQTNTLDGQKAHDSFLRVAEPGYFQEFGPAGFHVSIGFANPTIINDRRYNNNNGVHSGMCDPLPNGGGLACSFEVKGKVTGSRLSRTPDQRLYSSGGRSSLAFTQCYVSLGDPDGAEIAFSKCDSDGNFDFNGIPAGNWKVTTFDQWNDQIIDGITQPVAVGCGNNIGGLCTSAAGGPNPGTCTGPGTTTTTCDMGEIGAHQWQADIYTRSFIDMTGTGVSDNSKPGLALVATNVRFRDGSYSNFNNTDLNGFAGFNEVFPLFNWYVVETDSTRYKNTGVHVVYDAGGPADGSTSCDPTASPCGTLGGVNNPNSIAQGLANTYEKFPLPADLSVPGAVYCADADCTAEAASGGIAGGPKPSSTSTHSTGRIDPPFWFGSYGWQGYIGQGNFVEWGKKPYAPTETGPIHGHVVYASTRPFDDPQLLLQLSWEPLVSHVHVNLYREDVAADGVTQTLTLVDQTDTTSWDDWAQGFRSDGKPNMNCPGQQGNTDPFFYALNNQPQYLDWYNSQHGGPAVHSLPYGAQYKCYDGMHTWNQLQPAPYDGMYNFPSVTGLDPTTGKPTGTNCDPTACIPNPDTTDPYRAGTPMLKAGKYVVEVVVPPGYELVKEEDKNILIGDNYIAPAVVQIPGLASAVYILPDQAALAAAYNPLNAQNATTNLGRNSALPSHEGDTGSIETFWPCVGEVRQVPDFISLFPQSGEVAPFAGAFRPLCDRKEVTLDPQTSPLAKFYLFSSTHVSSHFQGIILDDFAAEFDPFSPQFGEKFAPAYVPVGVKDWSGNAVNRVYTDQFGLYNGLNYSTWEVNPPNPTGYAPTMMTMCMNDAGLGGTPDPLFQPGYSQFCYELPFMPGQTGYFDTPVVPVQAFASGSYNTPDCSYPDATPAVASVVGSDGVAGPWVSAAGAAHTLTINALGDQQVNWYGYTGPTVTTAPYNQQKITRHYGFGATQSTTQGTGKVTIGGINASVTSWSDTSIQVTVPAGVPNCAVQQQAMYGGSATQCGQLVITTADGKQSVDTVTVTIGGKQPTVLAAGATIQSAIDAAQPGDMIIVPPGTYNEMLVMWKPVRLQGVGAATTVVDANTHPSGTLLNPWRQKIVALFGLTSDGRPDANAGGTCTNDGTQGQRWCNFASMTVDRLPFEATLGWDAALNGNLAEQMIEPSLLGAYEGAVITVLGKGVKFPAGTSILDAFGATTGTPGASFPTNTTLISAQDCLVKGANPYPTNFYCNPSSIDGLGVRDSSQGGGGIFVHAYAHNLQIANNRVSNNTGTMSGGMTIGTGEHPDVALGGAGQTITSYPTSCETSNIQNLSLPFCFNENVNIHHNAVVGNSSMGDELFSSTPAGAGGVSINTGSDYYKFTNNWVCGNLSSGDGGGVSHIGFIKNGDIDHNTIIFNQSTNPSITTNGGGLLVMGAPDADPTTCGVATDLDCLPAPGEISPSDGTGPGLVVNANLILGNAADSGSGGGLRIQHVNGTDVLNIPSLGNNNNHRAACTADLGAAGGANGNESSYCYWNSVNVTNNIVVNNVAGWDGGGVSLVDALAVNIVNNTIVANDSTASSGTLFQSLFAPLASSTSPGSNVICGAGNGSSCPQVAGLVSVTNSPVLQANIDALPASTPLRCPAGHGLAATNTSKATCYYNSVPLMFNDAIWRNRSFYITVGGKGSTANTNQQNVVSLYNAAFNNGGFAVGTAAATQNTTGACPGGSTYWEMGIRGDRAPTNHSASGFQTTNSILTSGNYGGSGIVTGNPSFTSTYCNGSRSPPELGAGGYAVPPGVNEFNAFPNPVFTLNPSGVVDEGNNWISVRWGPLSLVTPANGTNVGTAVLANYVPLAGSPAIDAGANTVNGVKPPSTDFFGNARPAGSGYDIGAVEAAVAAIDLAVTKVDDHSGIAGVGQTIVYTIVVTNNGPGGVTNATLTDTLPGGTLFTVNNTVNNVSGWSCVAAGTGASCTAGGSGNTTRTGTMTLPPGTTATYTLRGRATNAAADPTSNPSLSITNSVTVAAPAGVTDPNTANNTATDTVKIVNPSFGSITPTSGLRNTTVGVSITGTNLTGATAVTMSGANVTCTQVTVVSDTNVTASCAIASAAVPGGRSVSVVTPNGTATSGANAFTVTRPTLTSISPASGSRGTTVPVTLTGTNLTGATAVTVSGAGVTANTIVVNQAGTSLTANLVITSGAAVGQRDVSVTTPTGNTNTLAGSFRVQGATGAFSGPTPALNAGAPSNATKSGTITLSNSMTGNNAGPLTLTAAPTVSTTSGTGTFTVTGGSCGSGTVLNPGNANNCTINVSYTPASGATTTTARTSTGQLAVVGSGLPTTATLNFTGN